MEKISMQKFQVRQPSYPDESSTDQYYLDAANRLLSIAEKKNLFKGIPEVVIRQTALNVIGYYQDVIADAGIWRAFINENRRLFGRTLPFYDTPEEYIEYELNNEDVRFMCWYSIAMMWEKCRELDPMDATVLAGADVWYEYLEENYEEAPVPEGYNIAKELDLSNPEDHEKIMNLGNWLYMNCYLLTPANTLNLQKILEEPDVKKDDSREALVRRIHTAMSEYPTGPLAFFVRQWTYLVLENRLPRERPLAPNKEEHPYYKAFVAATGGKRIRYFASYSSLNRFFIDALGWSEGEEHLPQLKSGSDFVLLVNPEKGMLCLV